MSGAGHVLTYVAAVGTAYLGGRLKDIVADVSTALSEIDEASTLAERQLRLHAGGEADARALVDLFTTRTHLGVVLDRLFGRRESAVLNALSIFSDGLDVCDPSSSGALPIGQNADHAIQDMRRNQRALRAAVSRTRKGRIASFIGQRAAE